MKRCKAYTNIRVKMIDIFFFPLIFLIFFFNQSKIANQIWAMEQKAYITFYIYYKLANQIIANFAL